MEPLTLPDGRPAAAGWNLTPALRHLNHGSFGAVPTVALQAQAALRSVMEQAPVRWFNDLPPRLAAAREALTSLLGAPPGSLALVPNASGGATAAYHGLPVAPGSDILVTDHGYGAVVMGAERLARRIGGRVRTVHVPLSADSSSSFDAIVAGITARTGLIVLDHVTSPTARFLPVAAVSTHARTLGIPVLVDGAHVPFLIADPLAGLDCDVWVGNLHKFGCAPPGSGILIARSPVADRLYPLIDSWGATSPFPARFDVQGTLDATSHLAAPAAHSWIADTWGWETVRNHATRLASYGASLIASAFSALTGEDHAVDVGMPVGPMRLVRLPGTLAAVPDALRARVLDELGAECAFSTFGGVSYLRLSAHAYNVPADYEDFAARCVPALVRWAVG